MRLVEKQRPARHVPADLPPFFEFEETEEEELVPEKVTQSEEEIGEAAPEVDPENSTEEIASVEETSEDESKSEAE